jgi:ribosome maturation factor RimP
LEREAKITELLKPTIAALDCQLWGIEYVTQARHAILRIFIDKEGGVDIEDCERVSRQVSAVLDVEDPVGMAYTLEVSSPGMDRQLFQLEQFKNFVGSLVKIRLRSNYEGRRNFKGRLAGVDNDEIILQQDGEEYLFPYELLDKAQIVPEFK